jgi:AMP phosphorylase
LNLDPESQLLASILAKKLSVGSKYVLIDIPCGHGAKVSKKKASGLKNKFIKLGRMLNLKINFLVSDRMQRVGFGLVCIIEI